MKNVLCEENIDIRTCMSLYTFRNHLILMDQWVCGGEKFFKTITNS